MMTIGLTGGIGSGKSIIARVLQHLGYPVYFSDRAASRLMNNHPKIQARLQHEFGKKIYTSEGILDKPVLAQLIFNNKEALNQVQQIVHPIVMEDFQNWRIRQKRQIVFFESAILFEAQLNHFFQHIICVTAPEELRVQRVIIRDQINPEQVQERIRNQLDDSIKCIQSDFVIHNDFSHKVVEQVLHILKELEYNYTLS